MQNESFDKILSLTKIQTHTFKNFCEAVHREDAAEIQRLDLVLESLAAEKKYLEFSGRVEERRVRRMRAALLANAKGEVRI